MTDLGFLLVRLWRWLAPPPIGADGNRVQRWRIIVVVATMGNAAVNMGFIALALGAVPAVWTGFAPAATVEQLQAQNTHVQAQQAVQLAEVQRNQLDSKILDTRTRQCRAIEARAKGNGDADQVIQFATGRLQEELDDYWDLTKRRYRLPDCSEV